jgi:ethanolamine transporter EutH
MDRIPLIEEQDERILAASATPGKISVPRACFVSIAVVSTSNTKELIRD